MQMASLKDEIINRRRAFLKRIEENAYEQPKEQKTVLETWVQERREEALKRRKMQIFENALRKAPKELFHRPKWRVILAEVAVKTGFTIEELLGRGRQPALTAARHECFFRIHREVGMSTIEIAERFSGRDHSTVVHGIHKHRRKLENEQCTTKTS